MLSSQFCFAQNEAVLAVYTRQTKIPQSIQQIEDLSVRQLAIQQLKQQVHQYTLFCNGKEYVFSQALISEGNKELCLEGNNSVYMNFRNNEKVSLQRILDRQFVVEDSIGKYDWDISHDEHKDILGKRCMKATLKNNPDVVAWYCGAVPMPFGPLGYNGLPGLIMELENKSAIYCITALEIVADKITVTVPEKDRITPEKFNSLKERKLKEYGSEDGTIIIRQ